MPINDPRDHAFTGVLSTDTVDMIKIEMDSPYLINTFEMITLNRNAEIAIYPSIIDIYPSIKHVAELSMDSYMLRVFESTDIWLSLVTLQPNMTQPAGIVGLNKNSDINQPLKISPIYTSKSFKGMGLATYMLTYIKNEIIPVMYPIAKHWSASIIDNNVPSEKLFSKVGMVPMMHTFIGKL